MEHCRSTATFNRHVLVRRQLLHMPVLGYGFFVRDGTVFFRYIRGLGSFYGRMQNDWKLPRDRRRLVYNHELQDYSQFIRAAHIRMREARGERGQDSHVDGFRFSVFGVVDACSRAG